MTPPNHNSQKTSGRSQVSESMSEDVAGELEWTAEALLAVVREEEGWQRFEGKRLRVTGTVIRRMSLDDRHAVSLLDGIHPPENQRMNFSLRVPVSKQDLDRLSWGDHVEFEVLVSPSGFGGFEEIKLAEVRHREWQGAPPDYGFIWNELLDRVEATQERVAELDATKGVSADVRSPGFVFIEVDPDAVADRRLNPALLTQLGNLEVPLWITVRHRCDLSEAGVTELTRLGWLRGLDMEHVTDFTVLAGLGEAKHLHRLDLVVPEKSIPDAIAAASKLPWLFELRVSSPGTLPRHAVPVTGALEPLTRHEFLGDLTLQWMALGKNEVAAINQIPRLVRLDIGTAAIDTGDAKTLGRQGSMRQLVLSELLYNELRDELEKRSNFLEVLPGGFE